MQSRFVAFIVAAICVGPGAVNAHHSFAAEFDSTKPITLRGEVTKIELINPHSWVHIDVVGEDGSVVSWAIEGGTPNTLFGSGVNKNTVPVGAEVVVDGYRARDGSKKASGRDIAFLDGRKLFLGGSSQATK